MINIAIVEDEAMYAKQLQEFLQQYQKENGEVFNITVYSDGDQIVHKYKSQFDIILMDVEMKFMDGMSAAEEIRKADTEVVIIFITNMAQYAIRGYEVDALDYVLKPVDYYQFSTKLSRAIQRVQRQRGGQILLQCAGGGVQLVETSRIYYLETHSRMLHYHTADGEFTVRSSLQNAESQLAPYHFARCNQCYLVNLKHVKAVENDFVLVGEARLEISRRQRAAFLTALASYIGGVL